MLLRLALVLAVLATACSSTTTSTTTTPATTELPSTTTTAPTTVPPTSEEPAGGEPSGLVDSIGNEIAVAPTAPSGGLSAATAADVQRLWASLEVAIDREALAAVGSSGDVRLAWLMSDLLRFFQSGDIGQESIEAFNELTGASVASGEIGSPWKSATDLLMAWDVPAPPGYVDLKARLYTLIEPRWQPFFDDPNSDIDWRFVTWGGVLIDNRLVGDGTRCSSCIPALDDPAVTDAEGGSWYADERIVFAVVIDGEARAYPKHIMEIHEMVNDTLGGRRIGIPYCTLCGSAQAYFTDSVPDGLEIPVLRTSGLLSRSNKVMYDVTTGSVFDTFLGVALTGPLHDAGVTLDQATVVTTTWGEWRAAHPETTIVAEDGGIGRSYSLDPLGDRDAFGPIFPVGDVDPRLPVQESVVGVIAPSGVPVAFPAEAARTTLAAGMTVELAGVTLVLDGGGLRAVDTAGNDLSTHEAFWFAWSQFQPDTDVWAP